MGTAEQIILSVAFLFKGITLNKKIRLDYESLRFPETNIFKWSGYIKPKPLTIVMAQYTSCSVAVKIEAKTPAKPIRWTVRNDIFNQRLPLKLGIIDKGLHTLHNKFQTEH